MNPRHLLAAAIASLTALNPLRTAAPKVLSNAELSERIAKLEAEAKKKDDRIASLESKQAGAGGGKPAASAAPVGGKPAAGDSKSGSIFDQSISAAAAFTALDVSPETITKPNTPRDFAAGLTNGVDRDGKLQTGFAMQATPFRYFLKNGISLDEYQNNYLKKLLYNTVLSLGTTKASDNGKELRLALGLDFTLWDDAERKQIIALKQGVKGLPADLVYGNAAAIQAANAAYAAKRDAILKAPQNGWKVTAAWSPIWISPDGKSSSLKADGSAAWMTGSYAFQTDAMKTPGAFITEASFLTHLRYRDAEHVTDSKTPTRTARADTLMVAAGLRLGDDNWHAQVETAYRQEWHGLNGDVGTVRLGGGFERRVSKNLWFVLQVGNDFGSGKKKEELYSLGSFRFGTEDKPNYTRLTEK
jgi:hypothetical protein